mgnify:CR=1 FL=1
MNFEQITNRIRNIIEAKRFIFNNKKAIWLEGKSKEDKQKINELLKEIRWNSNAQCEAAKLQTLLKEPSKKDKEHISVSPTLNTFDHDCLNAYMKTGKAEFSLNMQNDQNMAEILVGVKRKEIFEGLLKVLFDEKTNQLKVIVYHNGQMEEKTIYDGNAQAFQQKL